MASNDARRRLAWTIASLLALMSLTACVFALVAGNLAQAYGSLALLIPPTVAIVITRSQPRNGVAWVFLVSGVCNALNGLGARVATVAVANHWPGYVGHFFAWLTLFWFPGLFLLITLGLLYFPNGRLPGRSWRWLEIASAALMVLWTVPAGLAAWASSTASLITDGVPNVHGWRYVALLLGTSAFFLAIPCVLGAVLSLIIRWRRGNTTQRLQIRWVAAAGTVAVLVEIVLDLVRVFDDLQTVIETTAFSLIAVATGVAILRYRLYEIDHIVSRTVTYAVLTLLLGATYVGIVALAGTVIPHRYGSIGVAAATLAVAALFIPVRRRIQRLIDRRFDRASYNAARTVDLFAAKMRSDLSQAELTSELLRTVGQAIAPQSASIWLTAPPMR